MSSRQVLDRIAAERRSHLGAVSIAHGFMPARHPGHELPPTHQAWDEAAAALPEMWRDLSVRRRAGGHRLGS